MKLVGMIGTAVVSLALGAIGPVYAQQEQHEQQQEQKAKPDQPEEKKAQAGKAAKQNEKPAAQQEKTNKPEEKAAQQQDKNPKRDEKVAQQQQHVQQTKTENAEQHTSGNHGARIPEERFKANFGRQHTFHVSESNYRDRRFQYGGYAFGFVDPWPSNWLYTQDVYVVEINGVYYLCNPEYPGVNLVLSFTL
jgi:cytoskeletal protein RodZ